MSGLPAFAYAADGQFYACGDGPELYVYSGAEDAPLWKQFCEGLLVGVGASPDCVHSLDDHGGYTVWDVRSGSKAGAASVGSACHGLAVGARGNAVALTDRAAVLCGADGATFPIAVPNPTAAAFNSDGSRFLVGTRGGDLVLYDAASGGSLGSTSLGAPVGGVSWCGREWVAAAGNRLYFVAPEVQPVPPAPDKPAPAAVRRVVDLPGVPRSVTANSDGVLVACDDGAQAVLVIETHQYRVGGSVKFARPLGQLQFGPGTSLGIGLEFADANRLEVLTGAMTRNRAGLGKQVAPWSPRVELDQFLLRGAVATKRAGGGPIANVQQFDSSGGGRTLLYVGIALALAFLCCGGVGAALAVWRFVL